MINEVIHQDYINEQCFINRNVNIIKNIHEKNIQEQGFSTFEKVRSFSKSYMASYLSKALVVSVALSYLGFSFSTAFPICLALIVFTSFMSLALNSIKEAIRVLAQKSRECLTRIAQVINNIFEAICTFISSAIHLKALSFTFDKNCPLITL